MTTLIIQIVLIVVLSALNLLVFIDTEIQEWPTQNSNYEEPVIEEEVIEEEIEEEIPIEYYYYYYYENILEQ